jgi:hypothetical protein
VGQCGTTVIAQDRCEYRVEPTGRYEIGGAEDEAHHPRNTIVPDQVEVVGVDNAGHASHEVQHLRTKSQNASRRIAGDERMNQT